ncbi:MULTISPECIES: hypothetical protein [Burkholderia]|uniref:Uncharacterized protein n=2 Tax=Burkholderia cepacia complex TaxID=87882 RepID=A0AAP1V7T5_9BURK|nr:MULTISPECIES: hypothetical protein [Burkholderia]MBK1902047.1 hypothetical protein [Burkholderia contaminans]MBK1910330.1 hypothetical protein [Burkholderia contaminans]MBK1923789.1 hypothetical protein [Burkholderia contaminans]MBK1932001.1 hypothetical protein [Burkholderia contaminans]MBK1939250.1 hypothetical protein [Burkholderia contaminans]
MKQQTNDLSSLSNQPTTGRKREHSMIYFTAIVGPDWAKALLAQEIQAQSELWIAETLAHLSTRHKAYATAEFLHFTAELHENRLTIRCIDEHAAHPFRDLVSFLIAFTEPGSAGEEHRNALIKEAGLSPSTMEGMRAIANTLHQPLLHLATVLEQISTSNPAR